MSFNVNNSAELSFSKRSLLPPPFPVANIKSLLWYHMRFSAEILFIGDEPFAFLVLIEAIDSQFDTY